MNCSKRNPDKENIENPILPGSLDSGYPTAHFLPVGGIPVSRSLGPDDETNDLAFREWLLGRNVDCQTLTPELEQSLRLQFKQSVPPEPQRILVIPCDGLWPTRAYWAHRIQ